MWSIWCCKAVPTCRATATASATPLYGNSGNNLLDGDAGADVMVGGAGNDAYFVDNVADAVFENAGEGIDTVFSTAHFRLSANVEHLVLQGSADLQGYGNGLSNALYGNGGNNLLNGDAGADMMVGGAGNDAYFVDNIADAVFENAGEGVDTVYSTTHFRLSDNVENLILQGTADLQGYGNEQSNAIFGSAGKTCSMAAPAPTGWRGQGNDAYFVDNPGDLVTEQPQRGFGTGLLHCQLHAGGEYGKPGAAGLRRSEWDRQHAVERHLRQRRGQHA